MYAEAVDDCLTESSDINGPRRLDDGQYRYAQLLSEALHDVRLLLGLSNDVPVG